MTKFGWWARAGLLIAATVTPLGAAHAELVLSQLIVDLQPGKSVREDVEVWNNSNDRTYVAVEPAEILNPGTPGESRMQEADPEKRGLLVAPMRMILEPGQRKLLRVAAIGAPQDRERDYRVTVKPVIGEIQAQESGLKLLVGFDMLVMVRPAVPRAQVTGTRSGNTIRFRNDGNVSVEVIEGRQCDAAHKKCEELPGKRLYPGTEWTAELKTSQPAEYTLKSPGQSLRKTY
jgi:P pilus assembly chaperone PapD